MFVAICGRGEGASCMRHSSYKFMGRNFVSGLHTLKPRNLKTEKPRNVKKLKTKNFFFKKPSFFPAVAPTDLQ